MSEEDYQFLFKIILIGKMQLMKGDSGVGKTNLFSRFQKKEFNPESRPTIGVEFINKTIEINKVKVKCQIWDTAGQEKFRAITNAYYRGAFGAFVCYDVTKQQTFENIQRWLQEIRQFGEQNIVVTLVGNKIDLAEQRLVRTDAVQQFCEEHKVGLIETSALTNHNVDYALNWMVEEIYKIHAADKQMKSSSSTNASQQGEKIQFKVKKEEQKKQCC